MFVPQISEASLDMRNEPIEKLGNSSSTMETDLPSESNDAEVSLDRRNKPIENLGNSSSTREIDLPSESNETIAKSVEKLYESTYSTKDTPIMKDKLRKQQKKLVTIATAAVKTDKKFSRAYNYILGQIKKVTVSNSET